MNKEDIYFFIWHDLIPFSCCARCCYKKPENLVKHLSISETIKAVYKLKGSLTQYEAVYISSLVEEIVGKTECSSYYRNLARKK